MKLERKTAVNHRLLERWFTSLLVFWKERQVFPFLSVNAQFLRGIPATATAVLVNDIGPIQATSPRKETFRELVVLRSCIK